MRLFIGFDLPFQVASDIKAFTDPLRTAVRIQWSRAENLHVTIKFIGEWPEARLGPLREALSSLLPRTAIPITARGLGFYPNHKSPQSFWAGIEAPPALDRLARDTNQVLAPLGIEPEARAYSPHLTLARIRSKVPLGPLKREIGRTPPHSFGSFTAGSFCLYLSKPGAAGSVYTKLSEFPLEST
ncbi:MAG: RNA 2',3'-cyclic phosphodiesterase [Bryobacteraceae bacterium]